MSLPETLSEALLNTVKTCINVNRLSYKHSLYVYFPGNKQTHCKLLGFLATLAPLKRRTVSGADRLKRSLFQSQLF